MEHVRIQGRGSGLFEKQTGGGCLDGQTIDLKPTADTPKGWSVDTCQHLNGTCERFVDVTRPG
jgi:hypothetical protein